MAVYAIAPNKRHQKYITPGKAYEVTPWLGDDGFIISDDGGDRINCLWEGCAYLDGGNWLRSDSAFRVAFTRAETARADFDKLHQPGGLTVSEDDFGRVEAEFIEAQAELAIEIERALGVPASRIVAALA